MAVACQVARVLAKNPGSIKPADFRLKFERPGAGGKTRKLPTAVAAAWGKAKWLGAMVGPVEHRTISRAEAIEKGFLVPDEDVGPHHVVEAGETNSGHN